MNKEGCLYKLLQILEVIGTTIVALLYVFAGPGDTEEPWE